LAVVASLVETVALRAVEEGDAQAGVQVFALLSSRQIREGRGGNRLAVAICNTGLAISARDAGLRPAPRTRAAVNFDRSEMVVFIDPATRTLLRFSWGCG
jgi:hypothetical protein